MSVTYSKAALKALQRMPANVARRIVDKLDQYALDPESLRNNVVALQGETGYRMRVGDWRILFVIEEGTVRVRDIGPRGSIYD